MNEYTQMSESLQQLWGNQQQFFSHWFQPPGNNSENTGGQMYDEAVEIWENTVSECLAVQASWSELVRASIQQQEQIPAPLRQTLIQAQSVNDTWRESRKQLWKNWFELMKNNNPQQFSGLFNATDAEAVPFWQESLQSFVDNNMKLLQPWSGWTDSESKEASSKKAPTKKEKSAKEPA